MRKIYFSITLTVLFSHGSVFGKDLKNERFFISEARVSEKISRSTVLDVFKSQNNLVWIASVDGITIYDGHSVSQYKEWVDEDGISHQLNISKITETKSGVILLATYGSGLLAFDFRKKIIVPAQVKIPLDSSIAEKDISYIYVDSKGLLWLGMDSGLLTSIDVRTGFSERRAKLDGRISDIIESDLGTVYATSANGNLYTSTTKNDSSTFDLQSICGIRPSTLEVVHSTSSSTLLLGTRGDGLFSFNEQLNRCQNDAISNLHSETLAHSIVHEIAYDKSSEVLWIGTDRGLLRHSLTDSVWFNHDNSGLTNNEVVSLHQSGSGILWIGTYGGLNIGTHSFFERYTTTHYPELSSVVSIDGDNATGTWIATYNNLFREDLASNEYSSIKRLFPDLDTSSLGIMSIHVKDNCIYVGTRSKGLLKLDLLSRKISVYSTDSQPRLPSNSVSAILSKNSDTILVGTYGSGLAVIRRSDDHTKSIEVVDSSNGLVHNNVTAIFEKSDGGFLIGSEGGLQFFYLESRNFQNIDFSRRGKGFVKVAVLSVTEDTDGRIWIGTLRNGLFVIDRSVSSESLVAVPVVSISPIGNTVYALQPDEEGAVWASTSTGISRVTSDHSVRNFRYKHGLQSPDFEFGASHKSPSGIIYFGGSNGYNRFDPSTIDLNSEPPPVLLTGVNIAGEELALNSAVHKASLIELDYTDYYVTFEFSALDFIDPGNNLYRYKLDGFDPDWVSIGNRNTATYTNLPPGDYHFLVQAANSSGVWNFDGIRLSLGVNPPPWFSWWAWCLYGVLVALMIKHAKSTYDRQLIHKAALQWAADMELTADRALDDVQEQLEEQALLVETIHRFNVDRLQLVRECLTRHAAFLPAPLDEECLYSSQKRMDAMICLEHSLLYCHEELLANMHVYVNELGNRLSTRNDANQNVVLVNNVPERLIPARFALPVSIILHELLDNAFTHAFEPAPQGGIVIVKAEYGDSLSIVQTSIEVSDNGVGLPSAIRLDAPESEGLTTVLELSEKLGGTLSVTRDAGTKFTLIVPGPGQECLEEVSPEPGD
ncbi:two-component regulator propeller domain-containing protein [Parahaliea aestuarii]|uniref:two-component regulator propeller domain-containing protein n=1 Tax=Parahaliea aestuarii TaxID=1852021 RepID=UPI00164FA6FF|nr:two-component regulator propeller domain-containing protein [Parahaliea aestuarii]